MLQNKAKLKELTAKYGHAVPRYTSYPTAPEWKHDFDQKQYEAAMLKSNQQGNDYSLYLHIPFCESQCYYCGCNVVISPEHGIEKKYIDQVKKELSYYAERIDPQRKILQMAWGGGTPTYLSPDQIVDLADFIKERFGFYSRTSLRELAGAGSDYNEHEYAIEIDPRVTTKDHLQALYHSGFNRLSMGIQDFNRQTQEAINRLQSFEQVAAQVETAREIGFQSINFDLIYGLPHQTVETFQETVMMVKQINPERIALFNYAHIPSIFPFQKKYIDESVMPNQETKLEIFMSAAEEFCDFGYDFIGIDHFAKPNDALSLAQKSKSLSRNFQGYTTHAGLDMYSAGLSAISDIQGAYKQNPKKLKDYYQDHMQAEKFLISNQDDKNRREIIKELMANNFAQVDIALYAEEFDRLKPFIDESLLCWSYADLTQPNLINVEITELGRFVSRNIASCFDNYIHKAGAHKTFSKAL